MFLDLNEHCAKTCDLCLDIISDKAFWALAAQNGSEFVAYLKAFRAMRAGFRFGQLRIWSVRGARWNGVARELASCPL